jgi:Fe2+ transport system protein FeoA
LAIIGNLRYKCTGFGANKMRLSDIGDDSFVTIMGFEGGECFQVKMLQYGLFVGDCVRILRRAPLDGPLLISVSGREIALGKTVARNILVEVRSCDSH